MRTSLAIALAGLLILTLVPATASASANLLCPVPGHYCVERGGGEICTTVDMGDLEGPYTKCYDEPTANVSPPGQCTGHNDHYCYTYNNGRLCVTYDVGDLEGPRTSCF